MTLRGLNEASGSGQAWDKAEKDNKQNEPLEPNEDQNVIAGVV